MYFANQIKLRYILPPEVSVEKQLRKKMLFKNYLTSIFRELAFKSIDCYVKNVQVAFCPTSNIDPVTKA